GSGGPGQGFVDPKVQVQVANGTIAGKVTNVSSGLGIAGATVIAGTQSNITDVNGNYSMSIVPGTYTVTASATGFQTNTTTSVVVTSGNVTTRTFALTPGVLTTILRTITVSPPTTSLTVSGTQMFNATALDQNNNPMRGVNITWTTGNITVGSVFPLTGITGQDGNASTTFTAAATGVAMVTATNGTVAGSANVTVMPRVSVVTSFLLTPDTSVVRKGTTINVKAKALNGSLPEPLFNGMANITITANNMSQVTFDQTATFLNGNATIHVTSSVSQFVTVMATNGTINGSTIVEFADMVIGLDMGWNLISIPSFADPSDINQTLKLVQNNGVQTFNPATSSFVTPTDLQPLYGYWINVTADNQKLGFIADTSIIIEPPTRNLFEGWNLIGVSASRDDTIDSIRLDMTPEAAFADLRNGEQPSQWFYSRLVSFDGAIPRTFTAGVDLTLSEPPLKQGHGYWLFIKKIPDTNENNVPWAGKLW
ncbi:MAG: carboxypeptidase regulatory-like domain-containing protein, partial [Candidatus Methanoperedens sp.]|nr:carboxypeptidase regulatory-like domain-containing protein [Candidatus Methanoperedens sp.]